MPEPGRPKICLSMIVKNEAHVIRRCLDSVLRIIDHWVIVDTGSTDGTQEIIRKHLRHIPGTLHQRDWKDFAHNRSEALSLARDCADYTLVIDADDALELPKGYHLPPLDADGYTVDIHDNALLYRRTQIVSNRLRWFYRGVLHEFIECEGPARTAHLPIVMRRNHDGARRRDPETYRRDAEVLETALSTETDPFLRTRYTFYLAQSYRDCGALGKSLDTYLARARLGGWQEEVYVSLLQAARLVELQGFSEDEVLGTYEAATEALPTRVEAAHAASRFCRLHSLHKRGYEIAWSGLDKPLPSGALFAEPWVYDYGLLDELSINAYWCGRYTDCIHACDRLLNEGKMPADMRERVQRNRSFAAEKLRADPQVEIDAYILLLRQAREAESAGQPAEKVLALYGAANNLVPQRAEALHGAARYCRNHAMYARGYEFAVQGLTLPRPRNMPALEHWIYDYGLLDELAVNAYWVERYQDSVGACEALLADGKLPAAMRERVSVNRQLALAKCAEEIRKRKFAQPATAEGMRLFQGLLAEELREPSSP